MRLRYFERRLEKIEQYLNLTRKPIKELRPGMTEKYLGVDLSTEVDTHTLLTLEHNAFMHEYHLLRPNDDSWKDKLRPVPGIPQKWEDYEISAEGSHT